MWGKQAENCGQYLKKGRSVYVEGRLQTREWTNKEGQKQYTTEIVAALVQFLGARGEGGGGRDDFGPPPPDFETSGPPASGPSASGGGSPGGGAEPGGAKGPDDDIPF